MQDSWLRGIKGGEVPLAELSTGIVPTSTLGPQGNLSVYLSVSLDAPCFGAIRILGSLDTS